MPYSLYRYLAPVGSRSGGERERLVKLAKILTGVVAPAAGVFFLFLYLVAGR